MENTPTQHSKTHMPMSAQDFAQWGSNAFAYLKPTKDGNVSGYAIYAADGRHLAFVENRDAAQMLVLENELFPVYVH